MTATTELAPAVGIAVACRALGVSRAGFYRQQQPPRTRSAPTTPRAAPRALTQAERQGVRDVLNSERFVDQAPAQVQTALLDEGVYHCSTRTMYRILDTCPFLRNHPEHFD